MNMLAQFNQNQKTMSTRVIADLTEKRHDHVKRDVENMLGQLGLDIPKFGGIYFDAQNRQQTEYLLDEELTMTLVTGYNIVLRNRVIKRWKELEGQSVANLPDYPTALRLYADQLEVSARLELERNHAIATKAEIGSKREATSMATASKYKRENTKLKVQLDESLNFATIKKVQSLTGGTYDTYALRRHSKANRLEVQKAEDANYGSVNSYHKDAWLAVYNINLSNLNGAA